MLDLQNVIIESERLRIIPTSEKYAEDIFREFTDEITALMHPKTPEKIEDTLDFIKTSKEKMKKGEDLPVVILDKVTNEFLGHGGVHKLNTETPEPGIWIKKGAHGNKFGREAVMALVEWAKKNLRFKYIMYVADRRNVPSRKIAESLGGIIEAEYKEVNTSGKMLDKLEYRIYFHNSEQ
jgi:[ribosomal protein S5]-alanine N-acetyltransferase